jgi:gluconate kinase
MAQKCLKLLSYAYKDVDMSEIKEIVEAMKKGIDLENDDQYRK